MPFRDALGKLKTFLRDYATIYSRTLQRFSEKKRMKKMFGGLAQKCKDCKQGRRETS
jgi:hypothetical protein